MPNAKPFPLYTDGTAIYTTFDGGATYVTLDSGAAGLNQLTGDVTAGPGSGSQAATIAAAAVTNAKLANMAATTVKGSVAGGVPADLTATQLTALINPATSSLPGAMTALQFIALQNVAEYHLDCDLTATGDRGVIVPAQSGRTFVARSWSMFVLAITGTATGTAPTVSLGVSSAFTNIAPATTLASVGTLNGGVGCWAGAALNGNTTNALVTNSDLHISCGTAVSGSTVLSARVSVLGYWTAF